MQHIYVMQPLTVVENTEKNNSVISSSDDIEGETCQRLFSILIPIKKVNVTAAETLKFIMYKFHFKIWVIRY